MKIAKPESKRIQKAIVFSFSFIITAILAFWLPVSSYFLPELAEYAGIELKKEKQNYSMFSDDAIYITDEWELLFIRAFRFRWVRLIRWS